MAALLGAERPAALKPKLKPPSELELALKRKDPSKWGEISENRAEREIVARGAGGGGLRVPSRPVDLEHYALKQQLEPSASFAHSEARVSAEIARGKEKAARALLDEPSARVPGAKRVLDRMHAARMAQELAPDAVGPAVFAAAERTTTRRRANAVRNRPKSPPTGSHVGRTLWLPAADAGYEPPPIAGGASARLRAKTIPDDIAGVMTGAYYGADAPPEPEDEKLRAQVKMHRADRRAPVCHSYRAEHARAKATSGVAARLEAATIAAKLGELPPTARAQTAPRPSDGIRRGRYANGPAPTMLKGSGTHVGDYWDV